MHSIGLTTALLTGFVIGIVLGSGYKGGGDVKLDKLQDESGEFKFEYGNIFVFLLLMNLRNLFNLGSHQKMETFLVGRR